MKLIDFLILAAVALAVIGAFVYIRKNKKQGGCHGGCAGCPYSGQCDSQDKNNEDGNVGKPK